MSHHFVEFKDVSYVYHDGVRALQDISFQILHGESVGIVGANGAGKSTLIMLLNGYLMPLKGEIIVGDIVLNKTTRHEIRKRVGVVFQNPDDQLFMPTVYEDIAFGLVNLGYTQERINKRVHEVLEMVGYIHLKDRPPHHLSQGQKSAIAIAGVLAMQPDILVLDEPASSLDPKSRRQLINLLKGFKHTKIVASHDLDLIIDVCDRVMVLNEGRLVADGKTIEIMKDKSLLEANNLELALSLQGRQIL